MKNCKSDKVRLGVFGLGRGESLLENVLLTGAQVVAVCDKDEGKLNHMKEEHPELETYTEFDPFITSGLDGVVLCNFFHEHVPFAIKALEQRVAVLSECTPAATMAEAVELCRTVRRTGGKYMLAENYPFMCSNLELKRAVRRENSGPRDVCRRGV